MRVLPLLMLAACSHGALPLYDAPSPALDLDGDGLEDVIVGASTFDDNRGAVYVFLAVGGLDGRSEASADAAWFGEHAFQHLGRSVMGCDLDGDGTGDLVVGGGGVRIWWGGPDFGARERPDLAITGGPDLGDILRCGDVNGDGVSDLVTVDTVGGVPSVLVFEGREGRRTHDVGLVSADADVVLSGDAEQGALVDPAVDLADVDADGFVDVIVGSASLRVGEAWGAGGVHVFRGGPELVSATTDQAHVVILGREPNAWLGRTLAAGDLDGDGIDDLAIGSLAGRLELYRGGPGFGEGGPDAVLGRPEVAVDDPAWSATVQRPWGHDLRDASGRELLQVRARVTVDGEERIGAVFLADLLSSEPRCMGVVTEEPLRLADSIGAVRTEAGTRILLGAPGAPSMTVGRVFAFDPEALGLDLAAPCREAVRTRLTVELGAAELSGPRSFGAATAG